MIALKVLQYVWSHPANQQSRLRAVARACAWQASKRLTGKPWTIDCYDGLRMRCYPRSHGGSLMIYSNGMIDYDDNLFVRNYLRPGDRFLDVGANIGVYTLLAASRVGRDGKVLAFEPTPLSFEYLRENVRLNELKQVELHRAAVGETAGEVQFLQERDLVNRIADANQEYGDAVAKVPCVTLDEAVAGQQFTMGKMDIEGAEPLVFRGSRQALPAANPPVWLLEIKERLMRRYGFSAGEFAAFLRDHGYELANYDARKRQLSFPENAWQDHENVLAIHHSARAMVSARLAQSE